MVQVRMNRKRVSYAPTEDEEDSPTAPTSRGRIDPDFVLSAIDVPVSHWPMTSARASQQKQYIKVLLQ